MIRRWMTGAVALALVAGACGLGDKQAHADNLIDEGKRLMALPAVAAEVDAYVNVLPSARKLVVQDAPRIAPGQVTGLASLLHPRANDATVGEVVRFVDDAIYQRIAPKTVQVAGLGAQVAPNNLQAIVEAIHGEAIVSRSEPASATTSTTAGRVLRRSVQIVREWAAFDYAEIEDRDATKHAGSFALNPVALLRLVTGVLTGSVKREGTHRFAANVSRDKAERNLSEDEREVLDKMFTANAITRTVFPAVFSVDDDGKLVAFAVTLRQQLSSKDRADLFVRFTLRPGADRAIARPARRGTVTVNTLGELATTVSGA